MKIPHCQEYYALVKMSSFQFDAAPQHRERIIPENLININVVQGIEEDLDPDERLRCLFFLIEDYGSGFEKLLNVGNTKRCISEFIKENRITDWEEKLMEALCLLQNYEILLKLGVNPEDACTLFSSRVPEVPYKVNKYAKAFYSLFESLSKESARELLCHVYRSEDPPDSETWPGKDPLELHLLWWIRSGFIKIHEDKWSLTNLLKTLKGLNMSGSSIYDTLKNYDFNGNDNSPCHLDHQANDNSDMNHIIRNIGKSAAVTDSGTNEQYQINSGLVVIFNQMKFPGTTEYEYRTGSEVDCRRIVNTFENKFGFQTEVHTDLEHRQIYSKLDNLCHRDKKYDCIVVFILSHGTYGNIVASDGIECSIETIRSKLCSEALKDKPKILVLQACQRSALTTDGPSSEQKDLARYEDLLTLSSTIPGELSVRDQQDGTWFISVLCKVLVEEKERPADEWLRKLNLCFKSKKAEIRGEVIKQVPEYRSTLAKVLIFPWRARD